MSAAKNPRTSAEQEVRDDEHEQARQEMKRLEEGESVPSDPRQWPSGKAKFLTFGSEGDEAYGDGPTAMLGAAGVELHADGPPTIRGAKARHDGTPSAANGRRPRPPAAARSHGRFSFRRRAR